MNTTELTWFKSSYSTNDGPDCVEIATAPTTIHVRDSKQLPTGGGPLLGFAPTAWADFLPYASAEAGPGSL